MRSLNLILLSLVAAGIPGILLAPAHPAPVVAADAKASALTLAPPPQNVCDTTALRIKYATIDDANSDYWLALARCLNGGGGMNPCNTSAAAELADALDEAEAQFQARLAVCALLGQAAYNPQITPSHFSPNVTNPYMPLVPGTTLVYEGVTSEGLEHDEVTALAQTNLIGGVLCRAVHDVVTVDGTLKEDTMDWFAQHVPTGTVWYMGEVSQSYEDGFLDSLEGSWRFGKNGAKPGIAMLAAPLPNAAYRQEYDVNNAEDVARVIAIDVTVTVPFGTFDHCIEIEEFTPLEPGLTEHKFYAQGIGLVKSIDLPSGEVSELIAVN